MMEPSPIIIYAAARSGTTYLTQILNAHPEVFISDEVRLFAWLHKSVTELPKNDNLVRHHAGEFTEHLQAAYPELIRDFYRKLRPEARYWGDKNPHYAAPANQGCLGTIARLFPGARFIHILRDGRDVVASAMRGNWNEFLPAHQMWISHVDIGSAFGRQLPPEQYFELRYEDLIRDDLAMAAKLLEFLRIPMHPAVTAFCSQQRAERTPFCQPTRDIRADVRSSDWGKILTPDQQLRSLDLLGGRLVGCGYETADSLARLREELQERRKQFVPVQTPAIRSLVEVSHVVRAPLDEKLEGRSIDVPTAGSGSDVHALTIKGWALGRQSRVESVLILHGERVLRRCWTDRMRPDAVKRFPAAGTTICGFSTSVGVLGLPAEFELEVRAILEDGSRALLGSIAGRHEPVRTGFQPKLQPLMVTSLGRTGTTWLMRLLQEHPRIVAHRRYPYELRAAKYWMHMLAVLSEPANHRQSSAPDDFNNNPQFIGHNPFYAPPYTDSAQLEEWFGREYVTRLATFCQRNIDHFYQQLAGVQHQGEARFFAEKFHGDFQPNVVWELYPHAREIILVRDFRDMACSILAFNAKRGAAGFGRQPGESDSEFIRKMRPDAVRLLQSWQSRSARAHLVRYEDLVLRPVEALAGVLEYLGLEADPKTLLEGAARDASELDQHRTTETPELSIGRWRRDLDASQQVVCQETFGDILPALGYDDAQSPADDPGPSLQESMLAHLPAGATVVVISKGDEDLVKLNGCRGWHFPQEADGSYAGHHPANDTEAIAHLESLREKGADFLAVPRPSFWWLEFYGGFRQHLQQHYREIVCDPSCRIFALRKS